MHVSMAILVSPMFSDSTPYFFSQLSLSVSLFHNIMSCHVFRLMKHCQLDDSSDFITILHTPIIHINVASPEPPPR